MEIISISEIRKQIRIDDFEEEESILTLYGDAAESAVIQNTNRTVEELIAENMNRTGKNEFPSQLKVAILMTCATLYKNRESVTGITQTVVPYGYGYLVKPWIKLIND